MNNVLPQINGNRKRMINITYIMKQIQNDIQINTDYINITKSKKTLEYYHNYWNNILKLDRNSRDGKF